MIDAKYIFNSIRDINRLYEISASSQSAIELDFVKENKQEYELGLEQCNLMLNSNFAHQ